VSPRRPGGRGQPVTRRPSQTRLKHDITSAFRKYARAAAAAATLIPRRVTQGKLYEARVLAEICQNLVWNEHCQLQLVGGTQVVLRSSPGPIDYAYPRIEVRRAGTHIGDLWTDIEIVGLSGQHVGPGGLARGNYHELDIVLVKPAVIGRPTLTDVLLGVECKHTLYHKALLREVLGVRRELSLLSDQQPTAFTNWPVTAVPADPPSALLVYSSSPAVPLYAAPGPIFGVDFHFLPL
jgi:hypothetical protein